MSSYELLTPDFRVDILYIKTMEVINHSVITDSYLCGMSNKFLVRLGMHLDETLRVKNFPFIIRTGADHTIKNYLN